MERKKNVLRVLLAVALIIVTALLPFLTAFLQDFTTLGTPALGENQTVELAFGNGVPGLALLTLMHSGRQVRWQVIDPAAASMTMEEAERAAMKAIEPYQAAGLIPDSQAVSLHSAETRAVSISSGLAGVIWMITIVTEKQGPEYWELSLDLDDASGRIVDLSYNCETPIPRQGMEEKLRTFASIYFEQLGIPDHERGEVDDLENVYIGDTAIAQRYRFGDEEYGESSVDLYLYQSGFFTDFND